MRYRRFHWNGKQTPWFSEETTNKELERWTVEELLIMARQKKGVKKVLIEFLSNKK